MTLTRSPIYLEDGPSQDAAAGFHVQDDFERFPQKDDLFRRSWWDESIRSEKAQLFYATYREPLKSWRNADGFTQKDFALRNAAWHVSDIFTELKEGEDRRKGFTDEFTLYRDVAAVQVDEPAYCQGHYLVTRAAEGEMAGRSLIVSGTVTGPDGETQPFAIDTSLAWGTIAALRLPYNSDDATKAHHGEIGQDTLDVVILRELGTLFNSVDFDAMDGTEQAKTVLRNLTGGTSLLMVGGAAH